LRPPRVDVDTNATVLAHAAPYGPNVGGWG
jgi:hypothetical protein